MNESRLRERALRVREHVVRMAGRGGCFLGASLSCADVLVYLYSEFLRFPGGSLSHPERDILLLSKGHDVPALYGTLVEFGHLDAARLEHHGEIDDSIYWHPSREVAGVEFHSGSLGHLLAVGVGMALDARLRRLSARIVVVLGDGELDEGSVWESLLVASAHRLQNLFLIVDRNGFQANARTEELIPLEPLAQKFRSFGAACCETDGHSFEEIHDALGAVSADGGGPRVVVARTVRGKGLPSIEARADRWFCRLGPEEVESLLVELHGGSPSDRELETLVVR